MEIHAALVGGALSGGVVLLGVVLAEWTSRRGRRWADLVRATHVVAGRLPEVLVYFTEEPPDPRRTEIGSTGRDPERELLGALDEIDALTRPRLTRHRKDIREAGDLIMVQAIAASIRSYNGIPLTQEERGVITAKPLTEVVFGPRPVRDDLLQHYLQYGFDAPSDEEMK